MNLITFRGNELVRRCHLPMSSLMASKILLSLMRAISMAISGLMQLQDVAVQSITASSANSGKPEKEKMRLPASTAPPHLSFPSRVCQLLLCPMSTKRRRRSAFSLARRRYFSTFSSEHSPTWKAKISLPRTELLTTQ